MNSIAGRLRNALTSLWKWFRGLTPNCQITIILILYSSGLNVAAGFLGLGSSSSFDGYWQSLNWSLFPLFWIVTGLGMICSWQGFNAAWEDFFDQQMVTRGGEALRPQERNTVLAYFEKWRYVCLASAFLLASLCFWFDIQRQRTIYRYRKDPQSLARLSEVSGILTAFDGWLEDRPHLKNLISWDESHAKPDITMPRTWMNAWFFTRNAPADQQIGWRTNATFLALAYIQELVLIFYGFAITMQVWSHIVFFARVERIKIDDVHLEFRLNHQSPIREFGLERWNHALNNVYWLTTPGLIAAILSKYIHPTPGEPGQLVLQWGVPVFVTIPLVLTIVVRQARLPKVWLEVRADESCRERYLEQMLWPFDRNWASKLGILMAFGTLSYLVGFALTRFLP